MPDKKKKKLEIDQLTQEGLDLFQRYGNQTLRKLPFGLGSSLGLLESEINDEKYKVSDIIGLSPTGLGQALSLTALYGEKERENMQEFANKKNRGVNFKNYTPKKEIYSGSIDTTPTFKPIKKYAMGGDLTQINEGGTHSQNPLGGVPMGQSNSVEQGETKQNNFIYSDRIVLNKDIIGQYGLPKSLTNKTVADATKIIDKKFKDRNDKISTSTRDNMLSKIAEAQEAMKPQEVPQEQMFMGGELDSAEEAEGMNPYLNAGTKMLPSLLSGDKEQMINSGVETGLGLAGTAIGGPVGGIIGSTVGKAVSPLISKFLNKDKEQEAVRQNAIKNSSTFTNDFAYGGKMYAKGGILDSLGPAPTADMDTNVIKNLHDIIGITPDTKGYGTAWGKKSNQALFDYDIKNGDKYALESQKKGFKSWTNTKEQILSDDYSGTKKEMGLTPQGYKYLDPETPPNVEMLKSQEQPFVEPTGVQAEMEAYYQKNYPQNNKTYPKANLSKLGDTLGQAARYTPIAMNAYQLSQLEKPQYERLNRLDARFKPEYVDERSLQNIAGNEYDNTVNAITQMGGSTGATRNAILGAGLNKTKALGDAYMNASGQNRQMNVSGQQFNLGVDQANLNQANQELDINDRNQAAYRNAKREYLTGIGEGIGDVGKEEIYKKIAKNTTGYRYDGTYVKSPDGNVVTDPDTGKPMTEEKLKELQTSTTTKKALGGYLIKNKRK